MAVLHKVHKNGEGFSSLGLAQLDEAELCLGTGVALNKHWHLQKKKKHDQEAENWHLTSHEARDWQALTFMSNRVTVNAV